MDENSREFASYDVSESRFADIRAARERRRMQRSDPQEPQEEPIKSGSYTDLYPPYNNFPMDDTAEEGKKGSLVRVVVAQTIVCAVLLGALFGIRTGLPDVYKQLHAAYSTTMKTDLSVKEVWAAAKAVFAQLREDIYVAAPYHETTTAEPATEAEQETSSAENTTKANPEEDAEELTGTGGIDIALEYANNNCTFAPLMTTVKPHRPVEEGVLTSPFGYRIHPITGEEGIHTGMDIAAPEGTPISAAFYGTVLTVGESNGYGNYIIMEHAGGLRTLYAHCLSIAAEEGMTLRAGDLIAYVGSTGNSTGPHVHVEVRLNGLRCDPAPLFGSDMYPMKEEDR